MSRFEGLVIPEYEWRRENGTWLFQVPKRNKRNYFLGLPESLEVELAEMEVGCKFVGGTVMAVSDLNEEHTSENFDPVRIDINPLGEKYSLVDKAASRFGLQVRYWEELARQSCSENFRPSQALYFSVIPVLRFERSDYLVLRTYRGETSLVAYNYMGDNDAIELARKGKWGLKSGERLSGEEMGLGEEFFDQYLELRERIRQIERSSQAEAVREYLEGDDFKGLSEYFNFMSAVREMIIKRGGFITFGAVQEAVKKEMGEVIKRGEKVCGYGVDMVAEGLDLLIWHDLQKVYDKSLEKREYMDVIIELSELMNSCYPEVIYATE